MPRFVVSLYCPDDENLESDLHSFARQNKLSYDKVEELVGRYLIDGEYLRIQFDTDLETCVILPDGFEGVNDYDPYLHVPSVEEETALAKAKKRVADLQRQITQTKADYEALSGDERQTKYAEGLIKFIAGNRKEIKEIKQEYAI
jgi:hypothetical protein